MLELSGSPDIVKLIVGGKRPSENGNKAILNFVKQGQDCLVCLGLYHTRRSCPMRESVGDAAAQQISRRSYYVCMKWFWREAGRDGMWAEGCRGGCSRAFTRKVNSVATRGCMKLWMRATGDEEPQVHALREDFPHWRGSLCYCELEEGRDCYVYLVSLESALADSG